MIKLIIFLFFALLGYSLLLSFESENLIKIIQFKIISVLADIIKAYQKCILFAVPYLRWRGKVDSTPSPLISIVNIVLILFLKGDLPLESIGTLPQNSCTPPITHEKLRRTGEPYQCSSQRDRLRDILLHTYKDT